MPLSVPDKELNLSQIKKGAKAVISYVMTRKREFLFISSLGILSAIGSGLIPYISGKIFDFILQPNTSVNIFGYNITVYLALISIFFLVQIVVGLLEKVINRRTEELSEYLAADYESSGYYHLLKLPLSFHKGHKMGSTFTTILNAVWNLRQTVNDFVDILPEFLSIIVAFIIVFTIKPVMAVILLFSLVSYSLLAKYSIKPLWKYEKKHLNDLKDARTRSYDLISNVKEVKQATNEEGERRRMENLYEETLIPTVSKKQKVWENLTFVQKSIIALIQVSIFILGAYYIGQDTMSIGELVAVNGYALMLLNPTIKFSRIWYQFQRSMVKMVDAEEILNTETEDYTGKNMEDKEEIEGKVEFKNVAFAYEEGDPVLKNITFKAEPGEKVALVGETGAGKSTLVDLIPRYYKCDSGEVMIDDINVNDYDLRFLRSRISQVSQEIVLFHDTIFNNLKYGAGDVSDEEIRQAAEQAHCMEFIEGFEDGFEQIVGRRGVKLSVGQKQRVAIARAILQDPDILILDEPTSALDAKTEELIDDSLSKNTSDITTFVIAHRLSTVEEADKILVLDDGEIVERGNHDKLIDSDGIYKELYELQIGLY
ncbi:MAG: ABC transporter ATP-binding protein [Candidatus Magasanikbacteria bacterium]